MTQPYEDIDSMPIRRLLPSLTAALLLAAVPAAALAHAELTATEPADGAVLDDPPAEVVMTFDGELDPDGSGFAVIDAAGGELGSGGVDLQVAERNVLRGEVAIQADGVYTVEWTAVAGDGHTETGSFTFRVGPATRDDATPDTAVRHPSFLVFLGSTLVVMAAAFAIDIARRELSR